MFGLTYIRNLFNMSMDDVAKKLGVSKQTLSKWENKKIKISDERLNQLSSLFNTPKEYFEKELDEINKINIQQLKIQKEIKDNPIIVGYKAQLTLFGDEPIYHGENELETLNYELKQNVIIKMKDDILKLEENVDKQDIILEMIEMIDDDDCKREIIIEGLKYFDNEDTLEELKKEVNNIVIDD